MAVPKLTSEPREGYWIRIANKDRVISGNARLNDAEILSGDRVEIL